MKPGPRAGTTGTRSGRSSGSRRPSRPAGDLSRASVDKLREDLRVRPHAVTLGGQPFLDIDYDQFLLSVHSYDSAEHREFRKLIEDRLQIEISYSSLYGERFTAGHGHPPA